MGLIALNGFVWLYTYPHVNWCIKGDLTSLKIHTTTMYVYIQRLDLIWKAYMYIHVVGYIYTANFYSVYVPWLFGACQMSIHNRTSAVYFCKCPVVFLRSFISALFLSFLQLHRFLMWNEVFEKLFSLVYTMCIEAHSCRCMGCSVYIVVGFFNTQFHGNIFV